MFRTLKTAALSAVIGAGALMAVPVASQAEGLYLNLRNGDAGIWVDNRDPQGRRHYRERNWDRGCTAGRALDKADRMGIRRARIVDESRRTITVAGRQYGDRVTVTFGRDRHCPVYGR